MREVTERTDAEAGRLRGGIGSHRRHEQNGRAVGEAEEQLGKLARGGQGPVHVLDCDDDWARLGERLDPRDDRLCAVCRLAAGRLRTQIRIESDPEEPAQGAKDVRKTVCKRVAKSCSRLRADGDLRLGVGDSEPAAEHLLERPQR